jgi:hypothetical protein
MLYRNMYWGMYLSSMYFSAGANNRDPTFPVVGWRKNTHPHRPSEIFFCDRKI